MASLPEDSVSAKIRDFFLETEQSPRRILAAVSGGADSVCLLAILHFLSSQLDYELHAVTVDHRMRPKQESAGDASFVMEQCASLVPPVPCTLVELPEGEVSRTAEERGKGLEEAARHLRYAAFERTADALDCTCICTAHTRNDQLETVLMRFLQGGGTAPLSGIAVSRGRYLRPLLDVDRGEIEDWLSSRNIGWREDASNSDESYLRNRIRHTLVPCLDRNFPGWRTAVLGTAEKAARDEEAIRSLPVPTWEHRGEAQSAALSCPSTAFSALHPALRLRMLQDGLSLLSIGERIPYRYLRLLADSTGKRRLASAGMVFSDDGETVVWKADIVHRSKTGYLVSVCAPGWYELPDGCVTVSAEGRGIRVGSLDAVLYPPLLLRSRAAGDCVSTGPSARASGRTAENAVEDVSVEHSAAAYGAHALTVKKLFSKWGVSAKHRDLVPIIESNGAILAIYGSLFGYPDWINEEFHG